MQRFLLIAGLAAALAAAWPTFAQGNNQGRRGPPAQAAPGPAPAPPARPADLRGNDQTTPRGATLTPDERKDLRRDIRDHGREVYRNPPEQPPQR